MEFDGGSSAPYLARTPCVPLFCTLLNRGGNRRALGQQSFLGKRRHTPPCSSAELFFAEKKGVHRGKISVVDMVFLVFYRVFVSTTGLEIFSSRPEKFSKRFSFGGGCVRFFLLCVSALSHFFFPHFSSLFPTLCHTLSPRIS